MEKIKLLLDKIKPLWDKIKAAPLDKLTGYILLIPPVISVVKFILSPPNFVGFGYFSAWTVIAFGTSSNFTSSTSALPFYFGLMAIAGAYLIKDKK